MIAPGLSGFTRLPTLSEQYQILAELIDIALSPGERGRLVAASRLPDAFFATLLAGDFSHWSDDPVAPLALRSWLTLNRLYEWFLAGFKPTLADLTQGLYRTWWWQQHPISEQTLAAYWFWFEHTFAKEIPAIRAAVTPLTWRLAIHPIQQALVLHHGHEAAFLVSMVAEATGQIVAYRLVPWSGLREAPYHVLHDALALAKEKPHDLLVETPTTQVFTRMVT